MPISAKAVIHRCVETLQDVSSVRWSVSELVRYLNDGQLEIVLQRPDSTATTTTMTCVAGYKQTLPSNGVKLIDVICNTGSKRAVRLVNIDILDAQIPNWRNLAWQNEVIHYMYDPRYPRTFYVYPPATPAAQLDIIYAVYPAHVAEPPDGATYDAVVGNISVPDVYSNALQDYILYRAYMKDGEYANNMQRAQAHYAAFANALGVELKSTLVVGPNGMQ